MLLSENIKRQALALGFHACGISKAAPVDMHTAQQRRRWVDHGMYATMDYLARNLEKRLDPTLLMPGVKSIVSVALNYAPRQTFPEGELQMAAYALGRDYHEVVKERLWQLAETIGATDSRAFCDTAPVLERYWAEKSGIGWIGRNQQLIIPHAGTQFFLGELFLMEEVDAYDEPVENRCGTCHRCVDACPTGCLDGDEFDAEKCLSYQTIENRGELSPLAVDNMGTMFYGCDRCSNACPWNRFSQPTDVEDFSPRAGLLEMTRDEWQTLTTDKYKTLFKASAVKRVKYEGLMRNIRAVIGKERADGQTNRESAATECETPSIAQG